MVFGVGVSRSLWMTCVAVCFSFLSYSSLLPGRLEDGCLGDWPSDYQSPPPAFGFLDSLPPKRTHHNSDSNLAARFTISPHDFLAGFSYIFGLSRLVGLGFSCLLIFVRYRYHFLFSLSLFYPLFSPNPLFQIFLVLLFYSRGTLGVGGSGMPHGAAGICQCHRARRRMSLFTARFFRLGTHRLLYNFCHGRQLRGHAGGPGLEDASANRVQKHPRLLLACSVCPGRFVWAFGAWLAVGCLGFRNVERCARAVCSFWSGDPSVCRSTSSQPWSCGQAMAAEKHWGFRMTDKSFSLLVSWCD